MSSKVVLKQHYSIVNSIKPFFTSLKLHVSNVNKLSFENNQINF